LIFQSNFAYEASGGLGVSGVTNVISQQWTYVASGGLNLGGRVVVGSSQFYYYEASGGLGLGAEANAYGSDYGTLIAIGGISMSVLDLEATLGSIEADTALTASTDLLTTDCCSDLNLPQIIYVRHELHRSDRLFQFLRVNGFTLPKTQTMMYSAKKNSWHSSLHFRGNSANAGQKENWDIVFEFGCLAENATLGVPADVWGFMMSVQTKNLTNSNLEVTRLVLEFDPVLICDVSGSLKFKFSLNTKTLKTTPAVVRTVVFTDKIGSFRGTTYLKNPIAAFEVGGSVPDLGTGMFDQSETYQKVLLSTLTI
jgi:hypothetical protein